VRFCGADGGVTSVRFGSVTGVIVGGVKEPGITPVLIRLLEEVATPAVRAV